jgi:hypothetical protein
MVEVERGGPNAGMEVPAESLSIERTSFHVEGRQRFIVSRVDSHANQED